MHLSVEPLTTKSSSIRPEILSITVFFIVNILANKSSAIIPIKISHAMHMIHFPLAFEPTVVIPLIHAVSFDLIHVKGTYIRGAIGPFKNTGSMLTSMFVRAIKACTIRPCFDTKTMLFILCPVSYIFGALHVLVGSVALGLVIYPVTLIVVSIGMNQTAQSIKLVPAPASFVL